MFEYKINNITICNTSSFDLVNENCIDIENKIASWIIDNKEEEILEDIFERNYEGFDKKEKEYILKETIKILDRSKNDRRAYIEKQLYNYFLKEYFINVPGFIRFRLKEYRNQLEDILDNVINKYVCEKEYYEFIALIKEYIKNQDSFVPVLNVLTTNNKTRYFTENWIEISEILEKEYSFKTDLTENDRLLTILVLCAPEKIIWHNAAALNNDELKATIKEIFGNTMIFCNKCNICSKFIEK